jgi:DMSO reductase family type II enzyme heme b subunit
MLIKRVDVDATQLGDPDAAVWGAAKGEVVALAQAPAALQPTRYIAAKWQNQPYGQTKTLAVKALCNADQIAFRLEWQAKTKHERRVDNTDFPDAVAMLFPLSEQSPLIMGAEGAPVSLWYWRADHPARARNDVATGIGTSRVLDTVFIAAQAKHRDGHWSVVMHRALRMEKPTDGVIEFKPGQVLEVAFAVWDGGNLERAGIKAFSPSWLEMIVEA